MRNNSSPFGICVPSRRSSPRNLIAILLLVFAAAAGWSPAGRASASATDSRGAASDDSSQQVVLTPAAAANDSCATATVISPSALPFIDNSTTAEAANDVDPGVGGCVQGLGPDVIYSFTPAVTDTYTIAATPIGAGFDVSLYIVTDCSNPAGTCVAGADSRGFAKGEVIVTPLSAGIRYFIVIDNPQASAGGQFHFALRRGTPSNDTCAAPTVIEPSRLPASINATSYGANNDINPEIPCLRSFEAANGPEVIFQFTPVSSQVYVATVSPVANFDATLYIVTSCASAGGCSGSDLAGAGGTETVRRNLTAGTTYFIIIDGAQGDAGDFTLTLEPTIPIAPAPPSDLEATAVSSSQIDLKWKDNSDNELGFRIERSLDGSNFTEIATVGSNVTAFSDTTVFPDATFFYQVRSFNNFGTSAPSNLAAATTQPPPPPPVPVIEISPTLVDFGTVRATLSATRTVKITNKGGVDLSISAISDPAAPFSIVNKPALPLSIAPGQSIDLTVRFAPQAVQNFAGTFTITSNDTANPFAIVQLRGVGFGRPVPNLETNVSTIDFVGGESTAAVEVKNTGDADLLISSIFKPVAPFSVLGGPSLPTVVKPNESFFLIVSFTPAAPGVFTSELTIVSNDPDQTLQVIHLRGTSTPQNEQLKLRAPTLVTAIPGTPMTLLVLAANGTNSNIQLSASPVAGGVFTDRGNGKGDLALTPSAAASGNLLVTFTARDSTGRIKSVQSVVSFVAAASTHQVRVKWTAPATATNAPTDAAANDLSISLLSEGAIEAESIEAADAAGLIGYVIYRSPSPSVPQTLSNIVGVAQAGQSSFTDTVPAPPGSPQVFFYRVTALYAAGVESGTSNETSSGPQIIELRFKSKGLRMQAANSNIAAGAVLIVDGKETFALTRDGEFIIVGKKTLSAPGNLKPVDLFKSGVSHTVQARNPNGAVSQPQSFAR